jgi:hypothetical protein
MSVLNEFFAKEVEGFLYKNDAFMSRLSNVSEHLRGKTVHIPQYTNQITVVKNGAISLTKDADVTVEADFTYVIDDYSMDKPIVVQDIDELQTSYDKMGVVFRQTAAQFAQHIADEILSILITQAAANSQTILTTGPAGVANGSDNVTSKLEFVYADLLSAKRAMDIQNVSSEGRICLLDPVSYHELISDDNVLKFINYGANPVVPTAKVPMLAGFELMERSTVGDDGVNARYALCFVANKLIVANEGTQTYTSIKDTTWLGDAVRLRQALGATNPRQDGKNALLIKQG